MAGQAPVDGSLLAMIVDEDTATGMLLTGVGHVDLRKKSNFLIVDESECLWVLRQGGQVISSALLGAGLQPACAGGRGGLV